MSDRLTPDDVAKVARLARIDLADDEIERATEHVVLVGNVVVEGHRLHFERLRELAHGEGVDPAFIRALNRGA